MNVGQLIVILEQIEDHEAEVKAHNGLDPFNVVPVTATDYFPKERTVIICADGT